jgi:transglutaminase-like putative cysteine protease
VTDASSVANLDYTVASKLAPLGDSVDPAQQAATTGAVPAALAPYTELPPGPDYDAIALEAKRVTAGATNPYERARALRDYFRDPASGFVYDTTIDQSDSGSAILAFLREKHGFCVQFASAYAAMARSLGIPARVAVGFTPGTRDANGVFHVTSHDAHAWPEIWLAGLGWTHMFDPTPAASGVTTGGSDVPNEPPVAASTAATAPVTTVPPTTVAPAGNVASSSGSSSGSTGGSTPAGGTAVPTTAPAPGAAPRPHVTTASTGSDRGPWLLVGGILLVVALVVAGYTTAVLSAKSRRRRRRREATSPTLAVTGAWDEALERLREADCAPDPALTPLELARAVPEQTTATTEIPLRQLARSYTAARYGDVSVGPEIARDAWTSVDELEAALTHDLSWHGRWRRKLDPTTLR